MSLPGQDFREIMSPIVDDPVPSPTLRRDSETMKCFAKSTTLCVALVGGSSAFVGAPLARSSPALGIRGDDEHDTALLLFVVTKSQSQGPKAGRIFVPYDIVCVPGLRVAGACRTALALPLLIVRVVLLRGPW